METLVQLASPSEITADWLVAPLFESSELSGLLTDLDSALDGQLGRLRETGDLTGKLAETLAIHDAPGITAQRLLLVGLGPAEQLSVSRLEKAFMTAARKISEKENTSVACLLPDSSTSNLSPEETGAILSQSFLVGSVGQGVYQAKPNRYPFIKTTVIADSESSKAAIEDGVKRGIVLGTAMNITRDLVNRMADEIHPESVAERAKALATEYGLTCRVMDEQEIKSERMGSMLAVALGSDRPPRIVILEHRGGSENDPVLALVGKGVTFDSGGLSLKPTDSMKTMKSDMAGAATVMGAMTAIAKLKLPVNVVGYLGLVENMISGSSYKLGDVLHARNGVSIEVLNTDAEGRLVLADVLNYAVTQGADKIVDLATLTGACVVALGEEVTGVFSNDQSWCDVVLDAAKTSGEEVWQMPMSDHFADLLKSDVADCKNVGPRWGGAITAAKFLEKFVEEKPWVHLDIAGPSFASSNSSNREGGATGCMVRTLVELASRGF
ncbi:MAG: leucyl aminopeptidase [Planctomycetaceae bacterium]